MFCEIKRWRRRCVQLAERLACVSGGGMDRAAHAGRPAIRKESNLYLVGFLPGGMDGRATFAGRGDKIVAAGSSFVARASESAKEKKVIIQIKTCKGKHVTLVVSKGKGKAN